MRVLIVDGDSEMLDTTARHLRDGFSIDVVTGKADALDLLRQNEFHVLVACEQLADGSGLDLLSQAAKRWEPMIRLFAVSADRLKLLRGRLGPFKLFQTLDYPLNAGQLGSILMLAQAAQDANADTANVQHIVMGDDRATQADSPAPVFAATASTAAAPSLAVARGAARPLPFTVGSSAPSRPSAPPATRPPLTRESLAKVPRPRPAAPQPPARARQQMPAHAPVPRAADILPALAKLRAGLDTVPKRFRVQRRHVAIGVAILALATALLVAWSLSSRDPGDSPIDRSAQAAAEPIVNQIETELTADNVRGARRALERLRVISPEHDRLAFFEAIIARREALGRAIAAARTPAQEPAAVEETLVDAVPDASQLAVADDVSGSAQPGESALAPSPLPAQPTPTPAETAPEVESPSTTFTGRTVESADRPAGAAAAPPRPVQGPITDLADLPPVVREAKLIRRTAPDYPSGAAAKGTEGSVEVEFTVTSSGRVKDPVVVGGTSPDVFDRAALAAVRKWRYEPRIEDGVPVDWRTQVRIEFRLTADD